MLQNLVAGAAAGMAVDTVLYPLDTLKTRLQSKNGFKSAGGFSKIYAGLLVAFAGSAPASALFFVTYEGVKANLSNSSGNCNDDVIDAVSKKCFFPSTVFSQIFAAIAGETAACLVRVPIDTIKQNLQTGKFDSIITACRSIIGRHGILGGLYHGFPTTLAREIPFSCIQFPLYEWLKRGKSSNSEYLESIGVVSDSVSLALCGSLAGGIAAGLTTPLDVARTRVLLRESLDPTRHNDVKNKFPRVWREIYLIASNEGPAALFKGIAPRMAWISLGGMVFFGTYEQIYSLF